MSWLLQLKEVKQGIGSGSSSITIIMDLLSSSTSQLAMSSRPSSGISGDWRHSPRVKDTRPAEQLQLHASSARATSWWTRPTLILTLQLWQCCRTIYYPAAFCHPFSYQPPLWQRKKTLRPSRVLSAPRQQQTHKCTKTKKNDYTAETATRPRFYRV